MTEVAKHFDEGKTRYDLHPVTALKAIADVWEYGSNKYDDYNWAKGMPWMKMVGSTLRHVNKWILGEDLDDESGLHHLAHAGCDIMILLTYALKGLGTDNRAKL